MPLPLRLALLCGIACLAMPLLADEAAPQPSPQPARKPNILVVVGDDMGYADVGVHGCKDIPTPHIDSLATRGVRFSSGYVSGPYCSPTRAGLMTGRYQQRFGHEFNPGPPGEGNLHIGLPVDETTLADRLGEAGYICGMVGKWHLGHAPKFHPMARGFTSYFGFLGGAHGYFGEDRAKDHAANAILRGREPVEEKAYLTDALGREAVAFVTAHRAKPWFLYLTFNAVHTPMEAPKDRLERFAHIGDTRRRTYAAMMSAMDDALGSVLAKLRETGQDQDTLVFFVSDNGGPPSNGSRNHPLRGEKATTWEGGVRVPFLVQWPRAIPAGRVLPQPVIQLDIAATALAAAGSPAPTQARLDGVDLLPLLAGKTDAAPHPALYWRFGEQTAIRMGDYKLVQARGSGGQALYNLASDISESKDLSATMPDKLREMKDAYEAWNKQLVAPNWGHPKVNAKKAKKKA